MSYNKFDSDYLELEQTSQLKVSVLHKTDLYADTSQKFRGGLLLIFGQYTTNLRVLNHLLGFDSSWEQFIGVRKAVYLQQ